MRERVLWIAHFLFWLRVHRCRVGHALWATAHEMGAWKKR